MAQTRAQAAKTIEDLTEDLEIIEEQDPAQLDLEAALSDWIADLGGSDEAKISIYRVNEDRSQEWVDSFSPQEKDTETLLHELRNRWGGGRFSIQVRLQGRIQKHRHVVVTPLPENELKQLNENPFGYDPITMLKELRKEDAEKGNADNSQFGMILAMMQQQSKQQTEMMTGLFAAMGNQNNNAPPAPTMVELVSALAAVKELDGGDKSVDSINLFIKGVEMARDFSGGGGDTSMLDVLKTSINAFGGTMAQALAANPSGLPAPGTQAALPAPDTVVPNAQPPTMQAPNAAQPPAQNEQASTLPPMQPLPDDHPAKRLEPLVQMVLEWAHRGLDPYTYAGVLIDQFSAETAYVWFCTAQGMDTITSTFPQAVQYSAWLRAVGECIAEITHPDDDGGEAAKETADASTGSSDTETAPDDDATSTDAQHDDGDSGGSGGDSGNAEDHGGSSAPS